MCIGTLSRTTVARQLPRYDFAVCAPTVRSRVDSSREVCILCLCLCVCHPSSSVAVPKLKLHCLLKYLLGWLAGWLNSLTHQSFRSVCQSVSQSLAHRQASLGIAVRYVMRRIGRASRPDKPNQCKQDVHKARREEDVLHFIFLFSSSGVIIHDTTWPYQARNRGETDSEGAKRGKGW